MRDALAALTRISLCRGICYCYAGFVEKHAERHSSPRSGNPASPSFAELAAQQGIPPVLDFEAFLGKPFQGDESVEEFAATLRAWRRERTSR